MARRRFDDILLSDDDNYDFVASDPADKAFWDEFWTQEAAKSEDTPFVTVTIRNEETGEEQSIEHVRLRFRGIKKLRER